MQKPEQVKFYTADNDDLLEGIESAMNNIAEAMENLKDIREYDGYFNALGDLYDEMKPDYEMYEEIASREYDAEQEALRREYWRSVI